MLLKLIDKKIDKTKRSSQFCQGSWAAEEKGGKCAVLYIKSMRSKAQIVKIALIPKTKPLIKNWFSNVNHFENQHCNFFKLIFNTVLVSMNVKFIIYSFP